MSITTQGRSSRRPRPSEYIIKILMSNYIVIKVYNKYLVRLRTLRTKKIVAYNLGVFNVQFHLNMLYLTTIYYSLGVMLVIANASQTKTI